MAVIATYMNQHIAGRVSYTHTHTHIYHPLLLQNHVKSRGDSGQYRDGVCLEQRRKMLDHRRRVRLPRLDFVLRRVLRRIFLPTLCFLPP